MVIDKGIVRFLFLLARFVLINRGKEIILIKSPHPFNPSKFKWGDYYFSEDLAKTINKKPNVAAFVVPFEYWQLGIVNRFATAVLVISGVYKASFISKVPHYLYVISHPENLHDNYFSQFKHVFCASLHYAENLMARHEHVSYCPQFTDTDKLPANLEYQTTLQDKVIFIGNTRKHYREAVRICIEHGIDIQVYGDGWEDFIPPHFIKAKSVPNHKLAEYYASAAIVLNDHWQDMRESGFVSNRIYDVTACGGFLISDHIDQIQREFEGAIPTYQDAQELVDKINYYLAHPDERQSLAKKANKITLSKFTADHIGERLLSTISATLE